MPEQIKQVELNKIVTVLGKRHHITNKLREGLVQVKPFSLKLR